MIEQVSLRNPESPQGQRICMGADVEKYSCLDTRAQSAVQADLVRLLDEAAAFSGLDRTTWERQPQGDSEFAVLPESTPETAVLGPFVQHLTACLRVFNARVAAPRIRLRLAVDAGIAAGSALGHAGPAPVAVARYINSAQLKATLTGLPTADLAVMISDRLYQDVVRSGHPDLDPGQYLRVHVRVKEFLGYAWILVPGHGPDEMREFVDGPTNPWPVPPAAATAIAVAAAPMPLTQHVKHGAAVGRDVHGTITIGAPAHFPRNSLRYAR
ncbi:hypothetical protein ACIQBJ_02725 [Kitasatospora sp. NPDC088391]|uniref:hypothetical protein n=1 Tax=Kitasatospora sp. NPDC088391 TaxID=3364074 RepID=UPI00380A76CE